MTLGVSTPSIPPSLDHEQVIMHRGTRSGLPILVAVHSTQLGPALGGCRVWRYPAWQDGLTDVLRLSAAMTLKCAVAGLDSGGGKSVIALGPDVQLTGERRRDALLDLGDAVESLGGRYRTAEDVGTSAADMSIVRERTSYVFGLPSAHGGIGEPAEPTAVGVHAALRAVLHRRWGTRTAKHRTITISGLGQVGTRLAYRLTDEGAVLTVSDIDPSRQAVAREIGARWVPPHEALTEPADVVVPAGVGGVLTAEAIEALDCLAVVGPANNQLADDEGAQMLSKRGILWAPDFVANAGGAMYAILADAEGMSRATAMDRIAGIENTLDIIFDVAERTGVTTLSAAHAMARERLSGAPVPHA